MGSVYHRDYEGSTFNGEYGEVIGLIFTGGGSDGGILTPEDMWNVDTKGDDGIPATGTIVVHDGDGLDNHGDDSCTTARNTSDVTATYQLDATAHACDPVYRNQF